MKVDLNFKRQVLDLMIGGKDISYCFQCGQCNSYCPVFARVGSRYNPRDIVLFSALGAKDTILNNPDPIALWGCTACETCDEICPAEIPITEIIGLLKNMSVELGKAPSYYPTSNKTIYDNGKAIPVQAAIEGRRQKLGLQPAPKVAVDEVKAILDACGIPGLISKFPSGGK